MVTEKTFTKTKTKTSFYFHERTPVKNLLQWSAKMNKHIQIVSHDWPLPIEVVCKGRRAINRTRAYLRDNQVDFWGGETERID